MRPEQGLDRFVILCAAALFQRIAGGSTYGVQISGADGCFLRFTVRVGAAAHGIVGGKGLRGGHAVVRHHHREPAVRHGRQRLDHSAHTLHPAGAAHQGKGHVRTNARAQRAQLAHGKLCAVQGVQSHQHGGGVRATAGHTSPHRGVFVDDHIHPRQQPGVVKKRQRCLDGGVFIVGLHRAARQLQAEPGAAAQHHTLV